MRRAWRVVVVVALAACGNEKVVGNSTVTGAYTLRTVNGQAPPFTLPASGNTTTVVLDDTFILYEGSTFAATAHFRVTKGAQVTDSTRAWTGSYGLQANSITFRVNETNSNVFAIVNGFDMSIVEAGVTSVYRK